MATDTRTDPAILYSPKGIAWTERATQLAAYPYAQVACLYADYYDELPRRGDTTAIVMDAILYMELSAGCVYDDRDAKPITTVTVSVIHDDLYGGCWLMVKPVQEMPEHLDHITYSTLAEARANLRDLHCGTGWRRIAPGHYNVEVQIEMNHAVMCDRIRHAETLGVLPLARELGAAVAVASLNELLAYEPIGHEWSGENHTA